MASRRALLLAAGFLIITACGSNPAGPTPPGPPAEPPPAPQPPTPPPPAPVLGITRILAFGDSITAGTTSAAVPFAFTASPGLAQSYPYKLQDALSARYTGQTIAVHNAGWAGEFATAGRARFGGVLREAEPEIVLLMEGANDLNNLGGLSESAVATAIQRTVDAIEDMVREAQARGVTPMVATLPPQRADGPKGSGAAHLGRYNDGLRTMAAKKGAILVDVNPQVPLELIGQDGLHPTEAGYERIAEIFGEALRARYESTPTP